MRPAGMLAANLANAAPLFNRAAWHRDKKIADAVGGAARSHSQVSAPAREGE